jgi:membrane protein
MLPIARGVQVDVRACGVVCSAFSLMELRVKNGVDVAIPPRMLKAFAIPISWGELLKRTWNEFNADNCLGLAAQLAYYLLLALVPALVFLIALTSFFPAQAIDQLMNSVATVAPGEMTQLVRDQFASISQGQHGGLLTFGFAMALWSSSAAVVAITDALNRAYDIDEARPWWKVRLTAILLTIGLAAFVLVAMGLVLVGPTIADWLAARTGLGSVFAWTWKIVQWPIVFALVATALAVLNYFGPDADQDWTWVSPGAVLATMLWLVASLAFKLYVANFANYNETYGSLGGIIVLMLWFYISGLAILVGAEMNAEIEHASPYGKDPGEKVPGQRKKLGARAARAYEEARRAGGGPRQPKPTQAPRPYRPAPVHAETGERRLFPGIPVFLVAWWFRRRSNTRE